MSRFNSLQQWLDWQETLNPAGIDLGLGRIEQVMQQAGMANSFDCPLVMVAGTNGKGSVTAMLDSMGRAAGYRTATYTSPHLERYNERIRLNGVDVDDQSLCAAFERIDQARGDIALTYFEFGTLAAIDLMQAAQPELVIMEIGLGGRLDAVNVMQPDVSVITSIGLDHTDWLGDTRELIAREKAGIMRTGKPVIIADEEPPASLVNHASDIGAEVTMLVSDAVITLEDQHWSLQATDRHWQQLPLPALQGRHQLNNAAAAILALAALGERLPLGEQAIMDGLQTVSLPGRLERLLPGQAAAAEVLLDVAHIEEAIERLVAWCQQNPVAGKTRLVLAMLADKPVAEVVARLAAISDSCYPCTVTDSARALPAAELATMVQVRISDVKLAPDESVEQACAMAKTAAGPDDRILVTGSFYTVAAARRFFSKQD